MSQPIVIGTRGSKLALVQAGLVQAALEAVGRPASLEIIETAGDRRAPDTAWGEGAFVAAIREALVDRRADIAVHSAKDVPTEPDERLAIAAYLPRADPRDALVVRPDASARRLAELAPGSTVGTDSPRRAGFLRAIRPDLQIRPLHGNVDTRLRRLDAGEVDALVLACAGLDRLGRDDRIAERLDPAVMPPAPGQGAIAIEIRSDDEVLRDALAAVDDPLTRAAVEAERAFLEATGGGCRAPVGALARVAAEGMSLLAGRAETPASGVRFVLRQGPVERAGQLAAELADLLREPAPRVGSAAPRVVVTRAAGQASSLVAALAAAGVEAVPVPAIGVVLVRGGLELAARNLAAYRWVVVTSSNGADAMVDAAAAAGIDPGVTRWAAVGASTETALSRRGVVTSFRPATSAALALAHELPVEAGDRVLVARADLAGDRLAAGLRGRGAEVADVVAYRTTEAPRASTALLRRALRSGPLDAVLFTSGSTVRGFGAIAGRAGYAATRLPAICIGPETAAEALACGYVVAAVAPTPDAQSLARTTIAALGGRLQEAS